MKYITEENVKSLSRDEVKGFIIFLLREEKRHEEDIANLRATIKYARVAFNIEGSELAAIYTKAGFTGTR